MDSGNSASLQSSSGGDEEYDSRTESVSSLFNSTSHIPSLSNPSHHHLTPSSSPFDPLSYLDSFPRSPAAPLTAANSLLNLDMVYHIGLRSETTCTDGGLIGSSSSSPPNPTVQSVSFRQASTPPPTLTNLPSQTSSKTIPVQRNSKKRSRASRRAPTTVLTTDTSNFRAMVQEFTGIPAPPFSASPLIPRNRFDLFSTTTRSSHLQPSPPPYLLRPFAQKLMSSSSSASSSIADLIASTNHKVIANISDPSATVAVGPSSTSLSEMGFPKHTDQGLLSMQNPMFTFQSLLQPSSSAPVLPFPRNPSANLPVFGLKSQELASSDSSELRMGRNHAAPRSAGEEGREQGEGGRVREEGKEGIAGEEHRK